MILTLDVVKNTQTAFVFKYLIFNVIKRTQYQKKIINHVVILALINKMINDRSLKAIVSDARHIQSNGTLSWKEKFMLLIFYEIIKLYLKHNILFIHKWILVYEKLNLPFYNLSFLWLDFHLKDMLNCRCTLKCTQMCVYNINIFNFTEIVQLKVMFM